LLIKGQDVFFSWQRGQIVEWEFVSKGKHVVTFLISYLIVMMIKYSSMDGPHIWKGNISIHMYYECVHGQKMIAKSLKFTSFQFGSVNLLKLIFFKSHIKFDFLNVSKTSHVHVFANSWKNCLCYQVINHKIMQIFMRRKIIS